MLDDDFASLRPLEGDRSGETFVAEVGGERQVVRVYARDPARAEVDAALLRLVRGLVPVPDVLEVRPPRGDLPALLVTSFVPGVRGDLHLASLPDDLSGGFAWALAEVAATLAGMPTLTRGALTGAGLRIEPLDGGADGLPAHVEARRPDLAHWSSEELAGLDEVAGTAQALLDTVDRSCLVHGGLEPRNVVVDPVTRWITAVVGWEHAHAGHPFADLGSVLRLDRGPAYVEVALSAFEDRHGVPPDEALALARAADLWALTDLAGRRRQDPAAQRAHDLLRGIAASRDLGWTLPEAPA
ncbi:phosphotransferase [Nocardioides dongxiaopingii]|uniref:phosphotransferase family protein n=1 Tax=Nocardioides sp. S-1144 TaxID=2582905 RepID=UPI00110F01AB|nr:phosphotransferase [Nocardioides sp. S-1144]QCW50477.1 phosphotransferase [Nocardioides sp. S-1144]